jgi:hypothetical protein
VGARGGEGEWRHLLLYLSMYIHTYIHTYTHKHTHPPVVAQTKIPTSASSKVGFVNFFQSFKGNK